MKCLARIILPVILLSLPFGCAKPPADRAQSAIDESSLIKVTITDPVRLERTLELLDERNRLIADTRSTLGRFRREMRALNADFGARREVVVEIIDVYNGERAQLLLRFLDLVEQLKSSTQAAEWQTIAEYQLVNFDPRQMVYQRRQSTDILFAVSSLFLLGGGLMGGSLLTPADVDLIERRAMAAIDDSNRSESASAIVGELRSEIENYNRLFFEAGAKLRALYLDRGADPRQLRSELETINLEWYASQSRNMLLRDRLLQNVTAEEWAAIFGTS